MQFSIYNGSKEFSNLESLNIEMWDSCLLKHSYEYKNKKTFIIHYYPVCSMLTHGITDSYVTLLVDIMLDSRYTI